MPARPGKLQATFASGEIDRMLDNRTEQKAYNGGLRWAEGVEFVPQGGITLAPRTIHVGDLPVGAARLFAFTDKDGAASMMVASPLRFDVWTAGAAAATLTTPYGADHLAELDACQQLDTAIFWHRSIEPRRVTRIGPTNWTIDVAPLEKLPNWDYGGTYTNGVAAVWEIELIGVATTTVFYLTVSKQDTASLQRGANGAATAAAIEAAILDLANIDAGLTVTALSDDKFRITFGGDGNAGDGWAVSGKCVNKSDAAVIAYHKTVGVMPGEPVISSTRGWPRTGVFYQQRLLMAGFSSLPNAWIYSIEGDYYNFDDRLDEANGSALVPMDIPGGEAIVKLFAGRNLLLFTTGGEYWLSDRAIAKTTAPNHVLASSYGSRAGLPIIENEGGAIFLQKGGAVIGECRYTDVQGNYETNSISLVGAHLFADLTGHAVQRAATRGAANRHFVLRADGALRTGSILREQDVTGYGRWTTDGATIDVAVDGDNETWSIVARPRGGGTTRTIERFSTTALFDGQVERPIAAGASVVSGLAMHEGATVWAIVDADVFGPFVVASGAIALPRAALASGVAIVGRWRPPVIETLPLSGLVTESIWVQRRSRIHTVRISVEDTTSIAVAANFVKDDPEQSPLDAAAGRIFDVPLKRYGQAADVGELASPVSGWIAVTGIKGFVDEPTVLVTQLRPGRMTIKAMVLEATKGG